MLKVLKFGGSSLSDAEQYKKVKAIVDSDPDRKVVIVSAAGKRNKNDHKLTDLLYLCHAHLKYGVDPSNVFKMISDRYLEIEKALNLKTNIKKDLDDLKNRLNPKMSEDELVSRGEYFSAKLMASYLGFEFVDAADWLEFLPDGSVDKEKSYKTLKSIIGIRKAVIPGFYGVTKDKKIKTFSRGGSDITGSLVSAALNADIYENWTDVSGILIADPRIVKNPQTISRLTFSELRELSSMGAQVLHEDSIEPIREKNIPLNIKNTNDPENPGSMIYENIEDDKNNNLFITGIVGKKDYTAITVGKNGLTNMHNALKTILEIFSDYNINVQFVPSGIDSLSLLVESKEVDKELYSIINKIQKELDTDDVEFCEDLAIVAIVGRKMVGQTNVLGQVFTALAKDKINIRINCQDATESNVIIGVENKDFEKAIQVLYKGFVNISKKEKK